MEVSITGAVNFKPLAERLIEENIIDTDISAKSVGVILRDLSIELSNYLYPSDIFSSEAEHVGHPLYTNIRKEYEPINLIVETMSSASVIMDGKLAGIILDEIVFILVSSLHVNTKEYVKVKHLAGNGTRAFGINMGEIYRLYHDMKTSKNITLDSNVAMHDTRLLGDSLTIEELENIDHELKSKGDRYDG